MNTHTVVRGALAGIVGGMVMAMWSMIALWLNHSGFWQPLNLIAHTFWRGAPLDAKFSLGAAVLGLMVHMVMSMMLGVVFALAVHRIGGNRTVLTGLGMLFGIVIWVVMQYRIWPMADTEAARAFTPWVFALGHAMFGAATGLVVASGKAPAEQTTGQPRPA